MEENDRRQVVELLEQGRTALPAALAGVTDEAAARIPGPGQWSILGCVEHIAVSEDYLFAQILKATPAEVPVGSVEREAKMLARGTDRSRRIESPPEGHPRNAFPTLSTALEHFLNSRQRTLEFVRASEDDLRSQITWHPILKDANCHEMLLSMGLHVLRHIKQIEEIRASVA